MVLEREHLDDLKSISFALFLEGPCWITSFLILPSHYLNDLLQIDHSKEEEKLLHQELLSLITSCVYQEQNYLDFFVSNREKDGHVLWIHVISALTETLQFNDAHFYNLGNSFHNLKFLDFCKM